MRYILYLLYFIILGLNILFVHLRMDAIATVLRNYVLIVFLIVCIDFIIRLRKSVYVFYPAAIGVALVFIPAILQFMSPLNQMSLFTGYYIITVLALLGMSAAMVVRSIKIRSNGNSSLPPFLQMLAIMHVIQGFANIAVVMGMGGLSISVANILTFIGIIIVCIIALYRNVFARIYESEKEIMIYLIILNASFLVNNAYLM